MVSEKSQALGISEESFIRILKIALQENEESLPDFQEAIKNLAYGSIQQISHKLKGMFLNLGLTEIGQVLSDLNQMSIDKKPFDQIEGKFKEYDNLYQQLKRSFL